ncbi:unnamed protein product [Sympodiomycopsis kandeliae]
MSRAAKTTLGASIVLSALTVYGVHFMQVQERETMYKGVERDEARQAAKKQQRQRELDLQMNKEREEKFQKMQPTKNYTQQQEQQGSDVASSSSSSSGSPSWFSFSSPRKVAAQSVVEEAENKTAELKSKASGLLQSAGIGNDEDRNYIASRWAFNGLQIGAIAAVPFYLVTSLTRGTFTLRRLARANWTLPLTGATTGYASGYIYTTQLSPIETQRKSTLYRNDANTVRQDDYYIIGGVIGALITPAVFLRSFGLFNGLLGGGLGFGGASGLGYYNYLKYTRENPRPIKEQVKNAVQ